MDEKNTCNCEIKANNDDYIKKLELLALGTYSQRLFSKLMTFIAVITILSIIAGTVIVVYGINRYHNYLMNTEVVESVTTTEEYYSDDYNAGGHIIQGNSFDNSSVGAVNGENKESEK